MVKNTLAKKPQDKANQMVEFEAGGKKIALSPATVVKYLVNGNGNVTMQEVVMFINLCKYNGLNPFLREAYLIKYGNQPATMVVGKDAILKRAMRNPKYKGNEAGIIIRDKETGELENRVGTFYMPDQEELVGGWAEAYVDGYEKPIKVTVSFGEYCLMKNGQPASNWAVKPATMIRKVAQMQALREAFPEDMSQMYGAEESSIDDNQLPEAPIIVDGDTGEVIDDTAPVTPDAPAQQNHIPAQDDSSSVQDSFFD